MTSVVVLFRRTEDKLEYYLYSSVQYFSLVCLRVSKMPTLSVRERAYRNNKSMGHNRCCAQSDKEGNQILSNSSNRSATSKYTPCADKQWLEEATTQPCCHRGSFRVKWMSFAVGQDKTTNMVSDDLRRRKIMG
jgi:hypothetical protein